MLPKKHDFTFKRGDGWTLTISATTAVDGAFDLTGSRLILQVRKHPDATTAIQTFDMSYSGTADEGIFQATVDANTTADLSIGRFVYDAELILSGLQPITIAEGAFTITSDTSRLESYAGSAAETASTLLQISVSAGGSVDTGLVNATDIAVVISQFGGAGAATVGDNSITNAKLSDMANGTIKGRASAATGDPEDLSPAQVRALLNVADNAQANVKPDWNAAAGTDAEILNKPALGSAAAQDSSAFAAASHGHDADEIDDTATNHKFVTQAEKDKLAGIEDSATADQTPAEIKTAYESNANTNAFTDAEKNKLAGVEAGAQVNEIGSADIANFETTTQLNTRDTNNRNRSNHTGSQAISTVSGLQGELDNKLQNITGLVSAGSNVTVTGAGTVASPYVIASTASGGGGGAATDPNLYANVNSLLMRQAEDDYEKGRTALEVAGGSFDIFANESKVQNKTNVTVNTLSDGDNFGTSQIAEGLTDSLYSNLSQNDAFQHGNSISPSSGTYWNNSISRNGEYFAINAVNSTDIYRCPVIGDLSQADAVLVHNHNTGSTASWWTADGSALYLMGFTEQLIRLTCPSPYNPSGGTSIGGKDYSHIQTNGAGSSSLVSLVVDPTETKAYIGDQGALHQINFLSAGDPSSPLTHDPDVTVLWADILPAQYASETKRFTITEDGLRMYILGYTSGMMYICEFDTAWDINTLKFNPYISRPILTSHDYDFSPETGILIGMVGSRQQTEQFGVGKQFDTINGGTLQTEVINLTNELASNPTEVFASFDGLVPSDCEITLTLNDGTTDFTINANEFDSFQPRAFGDRTITATWNFSTTNANRTPILDTYVIYFR